eukprot:UN27691
MMRFWRKKRKAKQKDLLPWDLIPDQKKIYPLERKFLFKYFLLGLFIGVVSAFISYELTNHFNTDGFVNLEDKEQQDQPDFEERLLEFWIILIAINVVLTVVEIMLLYYIHVDFCSQLYLTVGFQMSGETDREILKNNMIHIAFDLPRPDTEYIGYNPDENGGSCRFCCAGMWYKTKIGFIIIFFVYFLYVY